MGSEGSTACRIREAGNAIGMVDELAALAFKHVCRLPSPLCDWRGASGGQLLLQVDCFSSPAFRTERYAAASIQRHNGIDRVRYTLANGSAGAIKQEINRKSKTI